jgi:hypothetical protein
MYQDVTPFFREFISETRNSSIKLRYVTAAIIWLVQKSFCRKCLAVFYFVFHYQQINAIDKSQMITSFFRRLFLAVFLFGLIGCDQTDMIQKIASPADQVLAKNYIDLLRQKRFEEIEKAMDSSVAKPSLHESLVEMANLIPQGKPLEITLVGAQQMIADDSSTLNLTYEYGFSNKWILTSVAVKNQGGKTTIVGFSVVPQPASLEEQNRFTLIGKTPIQYLVFVLAILLPILTVWALIVCVRTKIKGRKWPWVVFILFGFGKFAVNWTTGDWGFAPLAFQMLSASAVAPFFGQWTFAISIPVGAIIFLVRRQKLDVASIEK